MKIHDVFVANPLNLGRFKRPIINLVLDSALEPTTEPLQYTASGVVWTSQKFGPFTRYTCELPERESDSYFNVAFRDVLSPIVDVQVLIQPERDPLTKAEEQEGHFGLNIPRARQYMRKHMENYNDWRLLLDDHDAQNGLVSWVPTERRPACFAHAVSRFTCRNFAVQSVYYKSVDIPLCETHLTHFNNTQRDARQRLMRSQ